MELDKLMTIWGETLREYHIAEKNMNECPTDDAALKNWESIQRRLMQINTEIRRIQE